MNFTRQTDFSLGRGVSFSRKLEFIRRNREIPRHNGITGGNHAKRERIWLHKLNATSFRLTPPVFDRFFKGLRWLGSGHVTVVEIQKGGGINLRGTIIEADQA